MKRNATERKIEVLQFCSNLAGQKITHIQTKCNLGFGDTCSVVNFLLSRNLLEKVGRLYRSTEGGKRIVRVYREVECALSEAKP